MGRPKQKQRGRRTKPDKAAASDAAAEAELASLQASVADGLSRYHSGAFGTIPDLTESTSPVTASDPSSGFQFGGPSRGPMYIASTTEYADGESPLFVTPSGSPMRETSEPLDPDREEFDLTSRMDTSSPDLSSELSSLPSATPSPPPPDEPVTHFMLGAVKKPTGKGPDVWSFSVRDMSGSKDLLDGKDITSIPRIAARLKKISHARRPIVHRLNQFVRDSYTKEAEVSYSGDSWTIVTEGRDGPIIFDKEAPRGRRVSGPSLTGMERYRISEDVEMLDESALDALNSGSANSPSQYGELAGEEEGRSSEEVQESDVESNQGFVDQSYQVLATEEDMGQRKVWTFEVRSAKGEFIYDEHIETVKSLREELVRISRPRNLVKPPAVSMISAFLNKSSIQAGIFTFADGQWSIVAESPDGYMGFRPGSVAGEEIDPDDLPNGLAETLECLAPAEQDTRILHTWDIETVWVGGDTAQEGTWYYGLPNVEGEWAEWYEGPHKLKYGLAARAQIQGFDSKTVDGGPRHSYCRFFGAAAKEGPGKCELTTSGWRFEAPRRKRGKEGVWRVGRGCSRGAYFPVEDEDESRNIADGAVG